MQCFICTNQARDKVLCMCVCVCFMSSCFDFICGYLSCCQSWMRLRQDFHYCAFGVYALLWEEPRLNEGTDLCQRVSVNARGQRWTHTHTHMHLHAQPLVSFFLL